MFFSAAAAVRFSTQERLQPVIPGSEDSATQGDAMAPHMDDLQQELEERLRFETLLAGISARFVNLPAERIDSEIEDAQRRICECLGLDLSALWQWSVESPRFLELTHLYSPPEGPVRPERLDAQEAFPWSFRKLMRGEVLAISTEALPPEAARDRETRRFYGVKSSLAIPLSAGSGPLIGALSFDTLHAERAWPEPLVKRLHLLAQVFINALARKRADLELREKEARLSLTMDAAGAGLWIMEVDGSCVWVTPRTRELFHFSPDEALSYDRFFEAIHPEDRLGVDQVVREAVRTGKDLRCEFRTILPDGGIRWIVASGRRHRRSVEGGDCLMGVSLDVSALKRMEGELQARLHEIETLKRRLENENIYLRKALRTEKGFEKIIGKSSAFKSVVLSARQVATTDATVLLTGETGTGKSLVANAIHRLSARREKPLVTVNCSALPENLIESELFGREKGAFTGAHAGQAGRFEVAHSGTIFLDEIGEMPLSLQSKLLRVLQEGEFERLGSARTVKVDVRVIAATSRDLREEVRRRHFRRDLYYRLNVFPIALPPLRQRTGDIPQLAEHFVEKYARKTGKRIERIPRSTMKALMEYAWPGNVRELEHVIERGVIISEGPAFTMAERLIPPLPADAADEPLKDLATVEREHILRVLQETGWKIEGPMGAAAVLNLHPSTLRFRIKKLGIHRPA